MGQNEVVSQNPVEPENLVKSKQRVADHGEVFTPSWMVDNYCGTEDQFPTKF
jgi:hypothetical protein